MDSLTQTLFGALLGQAFQERLGRRSLAVGAGLALLPDLDAGLTLLLGAEAEYLHHRGISHSLVVLPLVGIAVGWLIGRHLPRHDFSPEHRHPPRHGRALWMLLAVLALLSQPVLDLLTAYGTQLFAPLSRHRFALNALPIIDLAFSAAVVLALLLGFRWRHRAGRARVTALIAIGFCAAWALMGWTLHRGALSRIEARAAAMRPAHAPELIFDTPVMFQPFYHRAVVLWPDHIAVGFFSMLGPDPGIWHAAPRQDHPALEGLRASDLGTLFAWFTGGVMAGRVTGADAGGDPVAGDPVAVSAALEDIRFGAPWFPVERGLWGIRGAFAPDGTPRAPAHAYRNDPEVPPGVWPQWWPALIGLPVEAELTAPPRSGSPTGP